MDARGQVLDEDLGNGLKVVSGFDALTGLIDYRQSGPGGGTTIQNLAYDWDLNGNLSQRQDLRQSLTETFAYDALNRLDSSQLNGVTNLDLGYDLIGNITSKSDVASGATWTYHGTKKHAVTTAGTGGPTFGYDANGNVTSRSGSSISWYSFNLPNLINGSGVSSQFWYGPDRQRFKHVANFASGTETTHYVGGVLEKLVTATNTHFKHYIAGPTGLIATYTRRASGSPLEDTFYFTQDHLGSVDSVSNAAATVQVRLSFDAFGKRRNESGWSGSVPSGDWTQIANTTRRGYTEHELIDNLALTHMNGRVYDQGIGRFLSADPFVQAPDYSQSLNRYAYVFNNPLSLTDPSGYESVKCEGTGKGCTRPITGASGFAESATHDGRASRYLGPSISTTWLSTPEWLIESQQYDGEGKLIHSSSHYESDPAWVNRADRGGYLGDYANQDPGARSESPGPHGGGGGRSRQSQQQVWVSVGYTETSVHIANHALVVALNPVTGEQFATRAGPGLNDKGGCCVLRAEAAVYDSAFEDNPADVHTLQHVGVLGVDLNTFSDRAIEFANTTNASNVAYLGFTSNSNSYAFTFLESLGFTRPTPIVSAPGWDYGTSSPELSYR